jgi:hypothetical protein
MFYLQYVAKTKKQKTQNTKQEKILETKKQ